jgi:enoyl-CoA hydratase/carnithine racemase
MLPSLLPFHLIAKQRTQSPTEPIRLKKNGGIVEVLFNRPEAFNAFDLNMCAAHPDGQEGLKAFSEKRKPKFNLR